MSICRAKSQGHDLKVQMWLTTTPQRAGICCPPDSHPILFNSSCDKFRSMGHEPICVSCVTSWTKHRRPAGLSMSTLAHLVNLSAEMAVAHNTAPVSLGPEWQHSSAHLPPTELFWTWSLNLKAHIFLLSHWVIRFKLSLHKTGSKQYLAKIISTCLLTQQSYF